jgi:hypothetical protein
VADDDGVALAVKEAAEAEELLAELERASLEEEPGSRPGAAQVAEQRELARFARGRVDVAQRRAEQAKETARREACADLGGKITALYNDVSQATTGTVLAQQAADAVARLRQWAAEHDAKVEALRAEAASLGARMVGGQPHRDHAFVCVAGDAVRHEHRQVDKIGPTRIDYAVHHAVTGDVDAAARELGVSKDHTPPKPDYYLRDTAWNGIGIVAVYGRPRADLYDMVRSGRLVRMTPEEAGAWLARQ